MAIQSEGSTVGDGKSGPSAPPGTRRLSAILAADVVGFSTLMEADGEATLRRLKTLRRETLLPQLTARGGRLFKTTGDGILVEFSSVVDAVRCAIAIQDSSPPAGGAPDSLRLRIGLHLGDVFVEDDGDLYGDGVNVAARLEQMADTGGICISGSIYDQIERSLASGFIDRGQQILKNIVRPIRVYAMSGLTSSVNGATSLADRPSIVVRPFVDLSGDRAEDYFSDGMVEEVMTSLSSVKWLFVIGKNSAFALKGRLVDSGQIGRDLGVRYVLEGSIRKSGLRVRVNAQLVEAATGRNVWGRKFDGDLDDIFTLQDQIAEGIVGAIEPTIIRAEIERAKRKPPNSLGAYDLYLRGLEHFRLNTRPGIEKARTFFVAAVERDPEFAEAWVTLASCIARSALDGWADDVDAALEESCSAASRGASLDPTNGSVIAMASWILGWIGGRTDQAAELAYRASDLAPNSASVLAQTAWTLIAIGEFDSALTALATATRLDPIDPRHHFRLCAVAIVYFFQRRFDESIALNERVTVELPSFRTPWRFLAATYARKGDLDKARGIVGHMIRHDPSISLSICRKFCHVRHAWMGDMYFGGLQLAGMPE